MSELTVGVTQTTNGTSISANAEVMRRAMCAWSELGADLVVFPECALTGFTSKHEPCSIEALEPELSSLEALARELGLVALVPSVLERDGDVLNGGWWLGGEERRAFFKTGLTESELTYFHAPESPGARVVRVRGVRVGLVVCREIQDAPGDVFSHEAGAPDILVWPGYWGWDEDDVWSPEFEGHRFVGALGVPMIQANFAFNDGAGARASGPSGRSVVVGAENDALHWGPTSAFGGVRVVLKASASGSFDVASAEDVSL